jgi:hypothetical protein
MFVFLRLLFFFPVDLYRLYRSLTGRGRTTFELRQWAAEEGMDIVALKPCGRPLDCVVEQFPRTMLGNFRYFEITAIDLDHVRRSGVARVYNETRPWLDRERMIDFVWFTAEQLNWRDRPPRRSAELPGNRAEGWYSDHTGAHELRWYSVGSPTDLVKDGAIENRDPPAPRRAR